MKIGILGGTFDPIHSGHSYIAHRVSRTFHLDRVLFMVSHYPPHKEEPNITSSFHRYAMTAIELIGEQTLWASRWELDQRVSYTIETLESFKKNHPQHEFCFVAGTDSLKEIHLWKDCGRLLEDHCFLFVQRPGNEVDLGNLDVSPPLRDRVEVVSQGTTPSIGYGHSFLVTLGAPAISSTEIRQELASGKSLAQDLISPSVMRYIKKHRLYEDKHDRFEESL